MEKIKYRVEPSFSLGRLFPEKEDVELCFLKDKGRVIFSSAFRRLEHKTQVFINNSGDHYRTRLTHSLEVAYVAKLIARQLGLNEELTETIALAHDLGHPPFGHAGEDGLSEAMKEFGGFNHNFHTLKIIGVLERCAEVDKGLNLSFEVIEGLVKHNGPLEENSVFASKVEKLFQGMNLQLKKQSHLEAQVASLADDIAYCAHDIDDGLRSGFFSLHDIKSIPMIESAMANTEDQNTIINNIRKFLISDLLLETKKIYRSKTLKMCSRLGIAENRL